MPAFANAFADPQSKTSAEAKSTKSAKPAKQVKPSFDEYIAQLKQEALAKGFEQTLIDESFAKVVFHKACLYAIFSRNFR